MDNKMFWKTVQKNIFLFETKMFLNEVQNQLENGTKSTNFTF